MFTISRIRDTSDPRIKKIITHPELWEQTNGQDSSTKIETFQVDAYFDYLLVENDKQAIALFSIKAITRILLEAHIRVLPEYRKDAIEIVNLGLRYIKESTDFKKLMTFVPANAINVIKFCEKVGWKFSGGIQKAIIYNNELVSLFLFEHDLSYIRGV